MKKGLVVVVIILIIAAGAYYYWQNSNPKPEAAPSKATAANEPTIAQNVEVARADLRYLHTALESWKVDNKTYPDNLFVLTTPVAYITQVPNDPFTQNAVINYKKISDTDFMLWSVGPDGKDDGGRILFNQNNGFNSPGDIVRTPTIP
jgi:type II secretory pathway pseudopilin PulG